MKKKMIIIIILILIFFIIGIIIGNHLLKEDEFVTNTITNTINDSSSNDNLLEYFSTNINNGTEIGNNECIYGMVTSINDNIIQISDIYRLRGGTGFQCEEYTSAFINIQDISSFIDYETLEEVNNNYDIIGNVIICHGKLVQNNNINFMMANKGEISVLDDMFFYNTLNEIINNKKEISNVEIVGIDEDQKDIEGGGIYCKYLIEDNENGYTFPCIFCVRVTDDTIIENMKNEKYEIGKKINITFENTIESIEVEHPIAKTIEYIDN